MSTTGYPSSDRPASELAPPPPGPAPGAFDRLEKVWRSRVRNAGPYVVTRWTDEVRHADPCTCDEDNESVGDDCMDRSEWCYALCVEEGEWLRPIVNLPRFPANRDEDGREAPDLAKLIHGYELILEHCQPTLGVMGVGPPCPCTEIAEEAIGDVQHGAWFGPDPEER